VHEALSAVRDTVSLWYDVNRCLLRGNVDSFVGVRCSDASGQRCSMVQRKNYAPVRLDTSCAASQGRSHGVAPGKRIPFGF